MTQVSAASPTRGALYFTASTLLLMTVGFTVQRSMGNTGIVLNQLLVFLGLAVAFAAGGEQRPLRAVFRLRPLTLAGLGKSVALGGLAWALVQMLGSLILQLVAALGGKMPPLYQDLAGTSLAVAMFTRALMPALCEEAAFRGYIQYSFGPFGDRVAVAATALLFGMMHFSLIRLIPLVLLGWVFAEAVQRSRSIVPGVLMHLTNNGVALTLSYFVKTSPGGGGLGFLSVPVLIVGSLVVGAAVLALAKSFGPQDAAGAAPEAAPEAAPQVAEGGASLAFVLPLLPALVIYAYVAWAEVAAVFGSAP